MDSNITPKKKGSEVSNEELRQVITDFLEMGHVENIVEMFKQDPLYYQWVGILLEDERFAVRLGVSVLFEYLIEERPDEVHLAVPPLSAALTHKTPWVRGEAISVLSIIGSEEALALIKTMEKDPDPQITTMVQDILSSE